MLEHIGLYVNRIWGSTLPTRLTWAVAVALIFEFLIWLLSRRLRKLFAPALQRDHYLEATERVRRRKVVLGLPLLLLRIVLNGIGLLVILRYLGFNTGAELLPLLITLLAVATVAFRPVLRDCVAGYFIMFDMLYVTGDRVTIGDQTGVVTEVGLRFTKLRGADGRETVIANSAARGVVNHTRSGDIEKRAQRL